MLQPDNKNDDTFVTILESFEQFVDSEILPQKISPDNIYQRIVCRMQIFAPNQSPI